MGLFVVFAGLAVAAFLVYKGNGTAAASTVGIVLGSTAVSFLYGRKKQADEAIASTAVEQPATAASVEQQTKNERPRNSTPAPGVKN